MKSLVEAGTSQYKPGVEASSKTKALLLKTIHDGDFICPVCRGHGHYYYQCPTKKTLDKYAKANDDSHHWGAWKWQTYYSALTPE